MEYVIRWVFFGSLNFYVKTHKISNNLKEKPKCTQIKRTSGV